MRKLRKCYLHLLNFPFHRGLLEVLGYWYNLHHDTGPKQVDIENHTIYRSIYRYDTVFQLLQNSCGRLY